MANKYTPTYHPHFFEKRILSIEEKGVLLEALMDFATPEWKHEDGSFKYVAFEALQTVFAETIHGCDLPDDAIATQVWSWQKEHELLQELLTMRGVCFTEQRLLEVPDQTWYEWCAKLDLEAATNANFSNGFPHCRIRGPWTSIFAAKRWELHSTATSNIESVELSNEDRTTWESCKQALATFKFSVEEEDKILGKAFGQVHSPYWGEERKKQVPEFEIVNEILDYLRSLSLSDEDLYKLLKKFPEVIGCSLEDELRTNVQVLDKVWGIKGKSLRNLLLRNPRVLGYNIDCKGDCMAQCTRCWARF